MTPVEQMRNPELTCDQLRQELYNLRLAQAQWWQFNVSFQRFQLRLVEEKEDDLHSPNELMIVLKDCSFLSGPTSWTNPEISLSVTRPNANETPNSPHWNLKDDRAGFEADGGVLYWATNVNPSDSGWF